MLFVNRNSFILTGAVAVGAACLLAAKMGLSAPALGLLGFVIVAVTLLFHWLGAGRSSFRQLQPVTDLIGSGQPVLLMFQSAY